MPRYAAKTDKNQAQIVRTIKEAFGPDSVADMSAVGKGFPDLCIGVRGHTILMEVKTANGILTRDQVEWHENWNGQVAIVRTADEALAVIERLTA